MKKSDVLKHFENSPSLVGKALGITSQAVSQWGENVPFERAWQLEKITNGKLKIDSDNEEEINTNQVA